MKELTDEIAKLLNYYFKTFKIINMTNKNCSYLLNACNILDKMPTVIAFLFRIKENNGFFYQYEMSHDLPIMSINFMIIYLDNVIHFSLEPENTFVKSKFLYNIKKIVGDENKCVICLNDYKNPEKNCDKSFCHVCKYYICLACREEERCLICGEYF